VGVVVLPIIGFGLLWWADQQTIDMQTTMGSTFEFPAWWTVLGWLLTLIAIGVMFGLAAGLAGANSGRANAAAVFVAGIIPLAVVVYYFGVFALRWFPIRINAVLAFLINPATVTVSSVVVGFLGAGLMARLAARSG
jgi:hypothetical protein